MTLAVNRPHNRSLAIAMQKFFPGQAEPSAHNAFGVHRCSYIHGFATRSKLTWLNHKIARTMVAAFPSRAADKRWLAVPNHGGRHVTALLS
jgi:hypothetical protein